MDTELVGAGPLVTGIISTDAHPSCNCSANECLRLPSVWQNSSLISALLSEDLAAPTPLGSSSAQAMQQLGSQCTCPLEPPKHEVGHCTCKGQR